MADTDLTWNSLLNQALTGADENEQGQNSFLLLHLAIKAAGWTVLGSSDGAVADATDRISVIADVIFASAGNAHTWVAYRSPVGFVQAGAFIELVVDCIGSLPLAAVSYFATTQTYSGFIDELNRPVASGDEWNQPTQSLNPSASDVPKNFHSNRSSEGSWMVATSVNGSQTAEAGLWMTKTADGADPSSRYEYGFYARDTTLGWTRGQLQSGNNWRGHNFDGTIANNYEFKTPSDGAVSLTNGLDAFGNANIYPIDLMHDNASSGRHVGRVVDIKMCADLLTEAEVEDGDTDLVRRVSVGDVWWMVIAAQLPWTN